MPTASTWASSRPGARSGGWSPRASAIATCAATPPALSAGGATASTVARKLAAIRGLYDFLVRTERIAANPADLVSSPKRDGKLPKVLSSEQVAGLLERIPGSKPLELRDRAMLELAYSCGLRCEEIINLEHRRDRLRVRAAQGSRQGVEGPDPAGRRAGPAGPGALPRPGPRGAAGGPARAGAVPLEDRPAALLLGRLPPALAVGPGGGARGGGLASRAAPLVRHPPAGGRRRSALDPGAARPFIDLDHADLHSGGRDSAARSVCGEPSEGLSAQLRVIEPTRHRIE